jgi:SAM-dependent methyltransferase
MSETMTYWEGRYRRGGNSGKGSRGAGAEEKARLVSQAVAEHGISSLLDIGCGDGYVAARLKLGDCLYLGVDISLAALALARTANPDKTFAPLGANTLPMDGHLSMDVMFHLTDERDYHAHLDRLFSARRFAIVYATNHDERGASHVLHREWTPDVPDGWVLVDLTQVTDRSTFRVFRRDS